jgi:hypothetical protein
LLEVLNVFQGAERLLEIERLTSDIDAVSP